MLLVPGFARSLARFRIVLAEQVKNVAGFQLRDVVRLAFFIDQQWKSDARFLAKLARVDRVAKPDRGERSSFLANGLLVGAQLRDVLAAENSSVMAQKNNHRGLFVPQGTQPDFPAFAIRQCNKGQPAAERVFHGPHLVQPERSLSRRVRSSIAHIACVFRSVWHRFTLRWSERVGGSILANQPFVAPLPIPTQDERTMGLLAHVLQIFTGFLGPLIILVIKRDSRFVKFHALQSIVWQFCFTVLFLVGVVLAFLILFATAAATVLHEMSRPHGPGAPIAFFLLFPLLWLFAAAGWVTNVVLGLVYGMRAQRGEWAGYPIIGKWFFP